MAASPQVCCAFQTQLATCNRKRWTNLSRPLRVASSLGPHIDSAAPSRLSRTVIIPKEDRKTIYSALFKDGCLVAPKNFEVQHPELELRNLYVVKAMQSLTSKGFVHTQFSWQWYFYTLTDEGLEYLREYLHLPAEIVPATHKRPARPQRAIGGGAGGAYRGPRGDREGGDRGEYRRRDAGEKKDQPSGEYRPRFAGVGRGAPRAE